MSIDLSAASTVVGLVNGTIGLLKQAKELAKSSDDTDLKEKLGELQDQFLELKDKVLDLKQENDDLRSKLQYAQAKLKMFGEVIRIGQFVYFKDGDDQAPCCSRCFDVDRTMVHIVDMYAPGGIGRRPCCPACKTAFNTPGAPREQATERHRQHAGNG